MEWCEEHLLPLIVDNNHTFVDWNNGENSYIDMQLMSECKSLIIANSSFSWWAAYLGNMKEMVIAPKTWFNTTPPLPIQLKEWTLL